MVGRFGIQATSYPHDDMEEFDLSREDVIELLTFSVAHKGYEWSRRYGNLLFHIVGTDIMGIKLMDEKKGYCSNCKGVGYLIMFDDEESRNVRIKCEHC